MENKDLNLLVENRNQILVEGAVETGKVLSFNEWKRAKVEIDHQLLTEEALTEGELITEGFFGNLMGKLKNWATGWNKKLDATVGTQELDNYVDKDAKSSKLGAIFSAEDIKTKPIDQLQKEVLDLVGPKTFAGNLFDNLFKNFTIQDKEVMQGKGGLATKPGAKAATTPEDTTALGKEAMESSDQAIQQRGEGIKKKFDEIAASVDKLWTEKLNVFKKQMKANDTNGADPASDLRYFSYTQRVLNARLAFNKLTQDLLLKRWDYEDLGDLQNKMKDTLKTKQENNVKLQEAVKEVEDANKKPAAQTEGTEAASKAAETPAAEAKPGEQPAAQATAEAKPGEQPAAQATAEAKPGEQPAAQAKPGEQPAQAAKAEEPAKPKTKEEIAAEKKLADEAAKKKKTQIPAQPAGQNG